MATSAFVSRQRKPACMQTFTIEPEFPQPAPVVGIRTQWQPVDRPGQPPSLFDFSQSSGCNIQNDLSIRLLQLQDRGARSLFIAAFQVTLGLVGVLRIGGSHQKAHQVVQLVSG
jgi:hypothetical protein